MTQAEQTANSLADQDLPDLTDEEVTQYLLADKGFFQRHPDVLELLDIPHEKGSAVSLVERQINLLREKNATLEKQLGSLIDIARENNETQEQIHRLVVNTIAEPDVHTTLNRITDQLAKNFNVEHVVIRLFTDSNHPLSNIDSSWLVSTQSARQTLDEFTPTSEPLCGRLQPTQLKRLFGQNAEAIQSSVFIPMRKGLLHGAIALGSTDAHRFNPAMDTLYMRRLGEMIAAALLRFID